MTCDHRMGYAPAAGEAWSGLEIDRWCTGWGEACGQGSEPVREVEPRRWVDTQCMTKSDHAAREREIQAGHLGLPMFHVEQPGVLVYCGAVEGVFHVEQLEDAKQWITSDAMQPAACPDMTQGMGAKALREALAALKAKEDLVRSAPPMSRQQYEDDLRHLLVLRDNVEREAVRCPPPLVRVGRSPEANANEYANEYAAKVQAMQAEAAAHARQMGEQHAGRMRKRQVPTAEVGRLGLDDAHIEGP